MPRGGGCKYTEKESAQSDLITESYDDVADATGKKPNGAPGLWCMETAVE